MNTPLYFSYLSAVFTYLYLYFFVPLSIILESYILLGYSIGMIRDENTLPQNRFRRGVAVFLPFLISLYSVLVSEIYKFPATINLPFYALLLAGLFIGFIFTLWISGISEREELFATLSCFVASLIFFAVLTVFVITRSFEIISFVFGFLFGVSVYVIRYGFTNLERFSVPQSVQSFPKRAIEALRSFRKKRDSGKNNRT